MELITMFACLASLAYPLFPEVCAITEVPKTHEFSDVEYCLTVQKVIEDNPTEWDGALVFCSEFDPDRDLERLLASDERMLGDVTKKEFDCLTDKSVRC